MDGGPLPPQAAAPVLAALYRYPVKGFSGQSLAEAALQPAGASRWTVAWASPTAMP